MPNLCTEQTNFQSPLHLQNNRKCHIHSTTQPSSLSLYEKFQSGFCPSHSTETALIRVTNDLLMTSDSSSTSLLIFLDLSAAFDTVDHHILLHRLKRNVGITGTALHWFKSYLTGRIEFVDPGSRPPHCYLWGNSPQGSVLGPNLFTIYMLPLSRDLGRHGIQFHYYADDTPPLPPPLSLNWTAAWRRRRHG